METRLPLSEDYLDLDLIFLLFLFSLLILFFLHLALILSTREKSERSAILQDIPSLKTGNDNPSLTEEEQLW